MNISLQNIKHWGLQGGLGILDQGIFSGANFTLNLLLARWLVPEHYGAYALGYSAIFFFLQLLTSYILDPMAVLGPSYYLDKLAGYLVSQVRLYLVLMVSLSGVFAGIVLFFKYLGWNSMVSNVFLVISLSVTLLLVPWLLRRVFYILGKVDIALAGGIVYASILLLSVVFLKWEGILTSTSSIVIVALAGLFSGSYLIKKLSYSDYSKYSFPVATLLSQNWKIGKWLIVYSLFVTVAYQGQIWISASFLGLYESGVLRALQVLMHPMLLSITALIAFTIPKLSVDFSKGNFTSFNQKTILLSLSSLFLAVIFEIVLLLFSSEIEILIYKGKFSFYASLLPIWGMVPIFLAYSSGIQAGFQSAQRPKALLISSILWAIASISFGIPLTLKLGLWGASWSAILGYLVFAIVLTVLYRSWIYQPYFLKK